MNKKHEARYKKFVAAIRKIDPYAADYLETVKDEPFMKYIPMRTFAGELANAFPWHKTEQGFEYWHDIFDKLQESEERNE